MTLSPFAHIYGLVNVVLTAWYTGACAVTPPNSSAQSIEDSLQTPRRHHMDWCATTFCEVFVEQQ